MNNKKILELPTTKELELLYKKELYKIKYKEIFKSTIYTLIIVIAFAVILGILLFPVLRIYGESMEPTLKSKDIVVSVKKENFKSGDIIAFYYQNKILVKRVIACSLDWVNIDKDGNVFVNDNLLEEVYIDENAYGDVDIEFPYQVPNDSYFVLGDKRDVSIDSRNSLIGSVKADDIIGELIFRVWPIKEVGIIK